MRHIVMWLYCRRSIINLSNNTSKIMSNHGKITAAELNQAITAGTKACLIDVRTPAEYETAHVDGSVLMPVDRLDCGAVTAAAQGAELRVLVCQSGIRAVKAAGQLAAAGLGGWVVLEGGVAAWDKAGLPLERGRFTLPLERQVFMVAGLLVFLGVMLGWQVDPRCYALSGFVGLGLMMAGLTGFCPMGILLGKMPWNQRGGSCCKAGGCCGN